MAKIALHVTLEKIPMVEGYGRIANCRVPIRDFVTFQAECGSGDLRRLHPIFEVTKKTDIKGNGDVPAHHHLRMTTCTTKFLAPPIHCQMGRMIKGHAFEIDLAFQESFLMTTTLETGGIVDISVRTCGIFSQYHRNDFMHHLEISHQKVIFYAWL